MFGLFGSASFAKGVTTVLDAGSAGAHTFPGLRKYVINVVDTRVYALLNISVIGQSTLSPGNPWGELIDIRYANPKLTAKTIEQNRDRIVGVKIRMTENIAGRHDLEALKLMIPNAAAKTLRLRQVATSPAVLGGVDTSGKLDAMEEVVVPSGRPWVLFTWFKPSAELIVTRLRKAGLAVESFTGDTPPEVRSERADAFQAGKFDVIVCTLAVGGVGIDLFRAGDCGFIEEDWTPTINDQAFARIDRMGQTQRPQRHIWRARGTVDTGSIAPTNRTKKLITDTIMGG